MGNTTLTQSKEVTFESILEKVEEILKSDKSPFCKVFDIYHQVDFEVISNIGVPGVYLSE